MASVKLGFIGFGEVGSTFTKAMSQHGADIIVYDLLLDQPGQRERVAARIRETGSEAASLREVLDRSEYVLSAVLTQVAKEVARTCARYLKPGQVYVDLNSTSPAAKVEIGGIVEAAGAGFVEGAILGAVGATGAATRILTAGERGQSVADLLNSCGLNVSYYSPEIGKASMFKMLRSIFSKGLEALILELLVAGKRAGIEQDLWEDIVDFMSKKPFDRIASNWVQSHAVAHERRYHEMLQVVETMEEIGIEPVMTKGTEALFARSVSMNMKKAFSEKPDLMDPVITFIEKRLRD